MADVASWGVTAGEDVQGSERLLSPPVPLAPLGFVDILDGAFALLRGQVWSILGLTAAVSIPLQLLASFLQRDAFSTGLGAVINDPLSTEALLTGDLTGGTIAAALLGLVSASIVIPIVSGAIALIGVESMLGRQLGVGSAAQRALRRGPGLIGAWWLHALLIVLPAIPALLVALVLDNAGGALQILLLPAAVIGAVLIMPLVTLATPAVMAEGAGGVTAIRRSVALARARYGSLLGATIGTGLTYLIVASVLSGLPTILGVFIGGGFAWVLLALGSIVSQAVTIPLTALAATLMYLDARCRVEGLDLSLRAAAMARGAKQGAKGHGAATQPSP